MRMSNLEIDRLMSAVSDPDYWWHVRRAADERYHERLGVWRERREAEGVTESVRDEFASIELDLAFQEVLRGLAVEAPADH